MEIERKRGSEIEIEMYSRAIRTLEKIPFRSAI